jgi:hypothetical protein
MQESEFTGCANKVQGTPSNRAKFLARSRPTLSCVFPQERCALPDHIVQPAEAFPNENAAIRCCVDAFQYFL